MRRAETMRVAGLVVAVAGLTGVRTAKAESPAVNLIVSMIAQAQTDMAELQMTLAMLDQQISEQRALLARVKRPGPRGVRPEASAAIPKIEGRLADLQSERKAAEASIADLKAQIEWLQAQLDLWQPSNSNES